MKRALNLVWLWSWLFTLPASIFFGMWCQSTIITFAEFGVRHRTSLPFDLRHSGEMQFFDLLRRLRFSLRATDAAHNRDGSELETIALYIDDGEKAHLDSNLPQSGFDYVDGSMLNSGKFRNVELRYRGDNDYHWGYRKKSWRVKTKKKFLYEGMRKFNLIRPKSNQKLNNYLSYRLASKLGVLSPQVKMVNLTLNNRPRGVHLLVEQLEESTLRRLGCMPGDLYAGEIVARDAYRGITDSLFEHPGVWQKIAVNNHFSEDSLAPIQALIRLVNQLQNEKTQDELSKLVDLEAFGRFGALEILTNTSHIDIIHNWRLYYDPWRRKILPVIWDPVGWYPGATPADGHALRADVITSPLHLVLHQNSDFLRARHQALHDFFSTDSDQEFLKEVDQIVDQAGRSIERDPMLFSKVSTVSPKAVKSAMRHLRYSIEDLFQKVETTYFGQGGLVTYATLPEDAGYGIAIEGRQPVINLALRYAKVLSSKVQVTLRFLRDGEIQDIDVTKSIHISGNRLELRGKMLARFSPRIFTMLQGKVAPNGIVVEPGYYRLLLSGIPIENALLDIFVDRGEGGLSPAVLVDDPPVNAFDGQYALLDLLENKEPLVWQGEQTINGVVEINQDLIILPGTTVALGPSASIILRGTLIADGKADSQIKFLPAKGSNQPWGTIALQGRKCSGSRLQHCQFIGGSGYVDPAMLFEYSAMFSAHDVGKLTVLNCLFRDSHVVDDMVHVVYSDATFKQCKFENALSDALDLDISQAVVEGCVFKKSGNDAVDLMTTSAVVLACQFLNNGDKGISVGEGSDLLAINDIFVANEIGVESKDDSSAILCNVELRENGKAINAYKKNWRYSGGGRVFLFKSSIYGQDVQLMADKKSRIEVHDCFLENLVRAGKRIWLDTATDNASPVKAVKRRGWRIPDHCLEISDQFTPYWDKVTSVRRGVSPTTARSQ